MFGFEFEFWFLALPIGELGVCDWCGGIFRWMVFVCGCGGGEERSNVGLPCHLFFLLFLYRFMDRGCRQSDPVLKSLCGVVEFVV